MLNLGETSSRAMLLLLLRHYIDPDVAFRWLLWWEVWVALHLIVAWFMPGILKTLASPKRLPVPAQGVAQDAGRSQLQRLLSSAALPAYHVLMALVLPAATGVAAFGGAAQLVNVYDFWR